MGLSLMYSENSHILTDIFLSVHHILDTLNSKSFEKRKGQEFLNKYEFAERVKHYSVWVYIKLSWEVIWD